MFRFSTYKIFSIFIAFIFSATFFLLANPKQVSAQTCIPVGTECVPYYVREGTWIIAETDPVDSRTLLNNLEDELVEIKFPQLPANLYHPTTQTQAKRIQDLRQEYWQIVPESSDHYRKIEFVINANVLTKLQNDHGVLDPIGLLLAHDNAMFEIWQRSFPGLQLVPKIDRIIVVADSVLSDAGGGWVPVNNTGYAWWGNDLMNNQPGEVPYDIDSRWAMTANWADLYPDFIDYNGIKVDYGLLHELTHHLPVGDNYVYNMGEGNGIFVPQITDQRLQFTWNDVSFMHNDHLAQPGAKYLTAPSSYNIKYFWQLNPSITRNPPLSPFTVNHVYGNYFFNTLTIQVSGLGAAGIQTCTALKEVLVAPGEKELQPTTEYVSLQYSGGTCTLVLNNTHQLNAWPGIYLGLKKNNAVYPLYFPRVLLETLYWKSRIEGSSATTYTFPVTTDSSDLSLAMAFLNDKISQNPSIPDIPMYPSVLRAYMNNIAWLELPLPIFNWSNIFTATIDSIGSFYIMELVEDRFDL